MNLLEILQKELTEFPEGMLYAVQDDDGEVKFGKHSHPTLWESGIWQRHEDGNSLTIPRVELAEDWDSAIVTKDMWEKDRVKQIIVNVGELSTEEKKRVNEALAKIMGAQVCNPTDWGKVSTVYVPSLDRATVGFYYRTASQTHTPQQLLEMAGMATNRKVRKDFDPKQPISVDVSNCTDGEKRQVQQAFFDVGIKWSKSGTDFNHLDAISYTNSTRDGSCYDHLLYGIPRKDSISHHQFLSMVYEPAQQGHPHADLMAQYAEDAKTTDKPWELWEFKGTDGSWMRPTSNLFWVACTEYRRKPKTKNHTVHGVEVPDLRIEPKAGDNYYLVNPTEPEFFNHEIATGNKYDSKWIERGLCYEDTEEGKQAAILHAKAMLGMVQE